MRNLVVLMILSLFLVGCKVDPAGNIHTAKIGEQYLCFDKQYLSWGDDPNDSGVFIKLMRPDLRPRSQNEAKKIGEEEYRKNQTGLSVSVKPSEEKLTSPRAVEAGRKRAETYPPTEKKNMA